jgi:hypothetical protein
MANFTEDTVVHSEFNDSLNNRQWTLAGHLADKPQLVIQKRSESGPVGSKKLNSELKVVFGAEDSAGELLDSNISITISARVPSGAIAADVDAAIDEAQLLVASTMFDDMVKSQTYLG